MRERMDYSTLLTLMIAANLIAFAVSGANISYFVVSMASYALLLFGFEHVTRLIRRSASAGKVGRRYTQAKQEVFALSREEAAKRAADLLADPQKFVVEKARSDVVPFRKELAAELGAFFAEYESVRERRGEFTVSWKLMGKSDFRPGFLRIGTDFDHVEVAVKPGLETIHEIDGSETDEGDMAVFPSIFHLILLRD